MTIYPLRLVPGQDLKSELEGLAKAQDWSAACILTGIGSLSSVAIRFAGAESGEVLEGAHEILSLAGTLSRNGSHLHILVSDRDGVTRGGHLMVGSIINTTAEIVLGVLSHCEFSRKYDQETGFEELVIEQQSG